jgi:TolB-like protein/DNA-binding winged helix-turn-helix (wHTH) protein
MSYRIGLSELDPVKFELRRAGTAIAVEPQVLGLLLYLVENRDRLITKDEIVERIWNGRIVSDSAVTSRVKSARKALGDDGRTQGLIRTVHGKGYRFVGEVGAVGQPAPADVRSPEPAARSGVATLDDRRGDARPDPSASKPSIAVLPFQLIGGDPQASLIADAFPHEVIAELSRLRWLFVIARGSSFRFRDAAPDVRRIGAVLGVRYCLAGSVAMEKGRLLLTLELSETLDGGVIWADHYAVAAKMIHEVRGAILAAISTALEIHIPLREAQQARLKSPENLDAWSAYHLGLQHTYRFNRRDNAYAVAMFERAIAKEPEFARAHAGLSFAHFQNAFLSYVPDTKAAAGNARKAAERALEIDVLDPFANFTFGRSLWLDDKVETSLRWLDRSIALSPNYAQGRYAKAWAETLSGRGEEGQSQADAAMALSPIDPMLYAMLATRALAHLIRGDHATAACWGDEAAQSPGAHGLVALIAAVCQVTNGDMARAQAWVNTARMRDPQISQARFFEAFPFADRDTRQHIAAALFRLGI